MPERAQLEYLYFTMQTLVGPDEKGNLKALASYAAATETPQDKGAIIDLHNLYLQTVKACGYGSSFDKVQPLVQVEGYQPPQQMKKEASPKPVPVTQAEIEIEQFEEHAPSIMTLQEAEQAGWKYEQQIDKPVAVLFGPSAQKDYNELEIMRGQWVDIGYENRKEQDKRRCYALVANGHATIKLGNWVLDSHNFAADYALVLFDGESKPLLVYGLLNALEAAIEFNETPPQTLQEIERFRLRHLLCKPTLCEKTTESEQAEEMLEAATGVFLYGSFCVAETSLREMKKEDNTTAYISACIMLAYLAQRRGETKELEALCGELAKLQPNKKCFWLTKQNLAHEATLIV